MRMQSRPLRVSWLLPAALMLGAAAAASAQEDHAHMQMPASAAASPAAVQSRWSDPRSWPDGKVPREGDTVTIGKNRTENVGENESITIAKNRTEDVGGSETITIAKTRS